MKGTLLKKAAEKKVFQKSTHHRRYVIIDFKNCMISFKHDNKTADASFKTIDFKDVYDC